jgi:hypothetical protein
MNEEITFPLHFLNFKIMNIIAILNRSNEIISNETKNILSNLERLSTVILCCNNKTENLSNLNEIENNFKNEGEKKTYFTVSQTK